MSEDKLLTGLRGLRGDNGAMASLRRGASETTAYRAWPLLSRWCDLHKPYQRAITNCIATSYALHPCDNGGLRLGAAMKHADCEARFLRLLGCRDVLELCKWIPAIIRRLKQQGISIDYEALHRDLRGWDFRYEQIAAGWAQDFYGYQKKDPE